MELFGTDGVRGLPGEFPLQAPFLEKLGRAAALELTGGKLRPLTKVKRILSGEPAWPLGPVLLARDTRASGRWILGALCRGLASADAQPLVDLGVLPTPAVSHLARLRGAAFAVVVSASHNPPEFNGVKFLDGAGRKLSPETERRIEAAVRRVRAPQVRRRPELHRDRWAAQEYLDFLFSTFPAEADLSGLRLVADAAHGAASDLARPLLERLGARVCLLGASPNGRNINAGCGALSPQAMCRKVLAARADCGFSLDGDADRVIFADERGRVLDGDILIAMVARDLQRRGVLAPPKVVVTVMSNTAVTRYLESLGIEVLRVPVGDRNVSAAMEESGAQIGGESSGHIIFRRFSEAGDGMLTALQVLAILKASGKPLSRLWREIPRYPQVLTNLKVGRRLPLEECSRLQKALRLFEGQLSGGRIFLRYSGTEPVLRILVEGPRQSQARRIARKIAEICREELDDHAH